MVITIGSVCRQSQREQNKSIPPEAFAGAWQFIRTGRRIFTFSQAPTIHLSHEVFLPLLPCTERLLILNFSCMN